MGFELGERRPGEEVERGLFLKEPRWLRPLCWAWAFLQWRKVESLERQGRELERRRGDTTGVSHPDYFSIYQLDASTLLKKKPHENPYGALHME